MLEVLCYAMILGLLPALIANRKGRSFIVWWAYGMLIFVVAIVHSVLLKPTDESLFKQGMKKCPYCAEMIKGEAAVCRHCKNRLP